MIPIQRKKRSIGQTISETLWKAVTTWVETGKWFIVLRIFNCSSPTLPYTGWELLWWYTCTVHRLLVLWHYVTKRIPSIRKCILTHLHQTNTVTCLLASEVHLHLSWRAWQHISKIDHHKKSAHLNIAFDFLKRLHKIFSQIKQLYKTKSQMWGEFDSLNHFRLVILI